MSCPPSVLTRGLTFRSYFWFLLIIHETVHLRFTCSMFTLPCHEFTTFYKLRINKSASDPVAGRGEGAKKHEIHTAAFFMTYLYRAGEGAWLPRHPPGIATVNSTRQKPCYGRKGQMFNVPSLSHLSYNSIQKAAPTSINWSVTVNYHLKPTVCTYSWSYYYRDRQYLSHRHPPWVDTSQADTPLTVRSVAVVISKLINVCHLPPLVLYRPLQWGPVQWGSMSEGLYNKVQCFMGNGHMGHPLPCWQNDWQTDVTENIAFRQLRWRAVNINWLCWPLSGIGYKCKNTVLIRRYIRGFRK